MTTDVELLEAWRGGDGEAGDRLFSRHFDSIYRFFHRKTGDAADLVQRTFLGCVESRDRFQQRSSFRTFLFSIARYELYGYWRRNRRQDDLDFGVSSVADLSATPSRLLADKRDERLLLEALRTIPLDHQIALELHYWEGLTGPQLAEVLEVPEGTVRSRLDRARKQLRKRLGELSDSPGGLPSTVSDLERWVRSLRGAMGHEG